MAVSKMCGEFTTLWKLFPDGLKDSGEYHFTNSLFKNYCPDGNCNNDIDKINAGCLRLFNDLFGKSGFSIDSNALKNDAVCIMIWLGYILSLKSHPGINTLNDFYSSHIQNNTKYTEHKIDDQKYNNYKNIIDEIKEYMDINISHMAKFYELLKLLCSMNTAYTNKNSNQASEQAKKFADEYTELFNDNDNIDGSSYSKVLDVLSKYYNNFENGRTIKYITINLTSLPTQKTPQKGNPEGPEVTKITEPSSETDKLDTETIIQGYDTTLSDSSLVNKLVIVLPILAAIPICLGIAYKYSLFGFRKRSKKQHLREKLKK
ncbi:PIR protein [Plasmodium yoelii]|uniref:PIR protein n=2 Tax=Plasmodium yoelii TaxID=5861 RepID=A0AAF0AY80_PLAYO|nr:PIR protein [Plasmodium yoelii]WBY54582.1 PIR protein [Plasmodium yoelii yoelii]CDU15981.1 YIR protein [Plasmodium yoelii]VTZ71576.1 PIR protein [Plasmodium yoelii]|eukprot:XP_022811283.1 PIR protein [Plasmodium yoelii]